MTEKDKDFLEGLAISAACHVLPVRKVFREPIAYSYNGVILPALPEWDREMYPYAWIRRKPLGGYWLHIQNEINFTTSDTGAESIEINPDNCLRYSKSGDEWVKETIAASSAVATDGWMVWANFDMYSTSGALIIAASDPIPVYE